MSIKQNIELVRQFYTLMSALEFDKMFELMADDATWTVAGNPTLFHHAGTVSKSQRVEALANFTAHFSSLKMVIHSITAQENRVAVELLTYCETRSGLNYENELMVLIRCRNGKIVQIYEHVDQLTALDFEKKLVSSL